MACAAIRSATASVRSALTARIRRVHALLCLQYRRQIKRAYETARIRCHGNAAARKMPPARRLRRRLVVIDGLERARQTNRFGMFLFDVLRDQSDVR